jgi:phytoene dehydrogenase-like protein
MHCSTRIERIEDLAVGAGLPVRHGPASARAQIMGPALPDGYLKRLQKFRYGPAVFKLDWALDGPIPWTDPRCLEASTVHIGGTLEEIAASESAVWNGDHADRPYLILCQQSQFDSNARPCRQTDRLRLLPRPLRFDRRSDRCAIEQQVERFAPGFRDCILARHKMGPAELEQYNPNFAGGVITGGAADAAQLFTRPVARLNPYTTPNPRVFICSASTPPGGGVHGMCGYHAARAALKKIEKFSPEPIRAR